MSSYAEALGDTQEVGSRENITFSTNPDTLDIVGSAIEIDATGTIFSINQPGLYHVEWSVNLQSGTPEILLCLVENGEPTSPLSNTGTSGNYSSGALINVTNADLPYTVSLHNFGGPIVISEPDTIEGAAVSIRILRFADGPS